MAGTTAAESHENDDGDRGTETGDEPNDADGAVDEPDGFEDTRPTRRSPTT